eukprot:GHVU01230221.1.p2 GENE.GHVU01230221.1~~GHVU01230221.1.p2  ORF type:complete len:118 (-),score=2.26 GHVU01230221.1:60-413(-)
MYIDASDTVTISFHSLILASIIIMATKNIDLGFHVSLLHVAIRDASIYVPILSQLLLFKTSRTSMQHLVPLQPTRLHACVHREGPKFAASVRLRLPVKQTICMSRDSVGFREALQGV